MTSYLPNSSDLDIREYLYVDQRRVGSLLAQFSGGLPESRNETETRSKKLKLSISSLFGVERDSTQSSFESLALADLHVSSLEEDAEAMGMLSDVSDQVKTRKNWLRGKVRNKIRPGMLIRVTAPTQISDISAILESFSSLADSFGNHGSSAAQEMIEQISSLYGNSITISILSSDVNDHQVGFVGDISREHDFLPFESELILSRIGPNPVVLTTLFQVAAVPTENDSEPDLKELVGSFARSFEPAKFKNGIDRRILDEFISQIGELLAKSGFIPAPRWPAISIIPLAIYRIVPSAIGLTQEDFTEAT